MATEAVQERNDSLVQLLRAEKPEAFACALEVLGSFYQRAEQGVYPLKPEEELDSNEIARAIGEALNLKVNPQIVFLSISNPFPQPDWMTDGVYQRGSQGNLWNLENSLRYSLEVDLDDKVKICLESDIENALPRFDLWKNLVSCFGDSLWKNLFPVLRANIWERIEARLPQKSTSWEKLLFRARPSPWGDLNLDTGLGRVLSYWLSFFLSENKNKAKQLETLVRVQLDCIILGIKSGEPNTWIVLCR